MAEYQEFPVSPETSPGDIYTEITNLLVGAYSVEVIPDGESIILRVWLDKHCDLSNHQQLP